MRKQNNNLFGPTGGEEEGLLIDDARKSECVDETIFDPARSADGESQEFLGTFFDRRKINKILALFVIGLGIILSRLVYLQIIKGADYRGDAERNRLRIETVKANRGLI